MLSNSKYHCSRFTFRAFTEKEENFFKIGLVLESFARKYSQFESIVLD